MSEYDKELDTRTPEYEKAIRDRRSGQRREKPDEGEKQTGERPARRENEEPQ